MSLVLNTLFPLFSLILLGYVCRRSGRLGPTAASELNRFVVWLGLPALLFTVTATSHWAALWNPAFIATFSLGYLAMFVLALVYRYRQTGQWVEACLDALGASYANAGYIGLPLCVLVFGESGLQPATIASLLTVCALFALGLVCIESGLHARQSAWQTLRKVAGSLIRNPLVVAPLAGVAWNLSGLPLPQPVRQLLDLLAAATAPCALVSLGLFLAGPQQGARSGAWPLVLLKLIGQPLVTWILAYHVFGLPPLWAQAAVLLSALPTGTGPFMLAEYYGRDAGRVSRTILLSTVGAVVTLSVGLVLLAP